MNYATMTWMTGDLEADAELPDPAGVLEACTCNFCGASGCSVKVYYPDGIPYGLAAPLCVPCELHALHLSTRGADASASAASAAGSRHRCHFSVLF